MILLRPMRDDEYLAYLDYFIPDYTAEITANYALSPSDALAQAQREIAADLPDGVNTRGQILLRVYLRFLYFPGLAGAGIGQTSDGRL